MCASGAPNTLVKRALSQNEVGLVPQINDAPFEEGQVLLPKAENHPGHVSSGVTGF